MTQRRGPKKVKEVAEELGLSVSAVLSILRELGYDVKSGQSKINKQMEEAVIKKVKSEKDESATGLKRRKKIYGSAKKPEQSRPQARPRRRTSFQKGRYSGDKRRARKKAKETLRAQTPEDRGPKKILIPGALSVGELASMMGQPAGEIILKLMSLDMMATVNQVIEPETIELVANEFGYEVELVEPEAETKDEIERDLDEVRPPVVGILGHVDHGKTTLLDYIRKSSVAAKEAGGMTQHIGAYQVEHEGYRITLLYTPGHAAFTTIRARGAQGADIVVLVVAANDGVQQQTKEAISHAKIAGCPIIVAITKSDLPNADPDKVKRELANEGLIPEDWGGDTITVPISSITGDGIDVLLDSILLKAEELHLRCTTKGPAEGVVLEAQVKKGLGPVATALIQNGTLKLKDPFVVGTVYGKVRAMYNDAGKRVKFAKPSDPVVVQGLSGIPVAGDILKVVSSEAEAKSIAEQRAQAKREALLKGEMSMLADKIAEKVARGERTTLYLVLKTDTQGSLEAAASSLEEISQGDVEVSIVSRGIGVVTEADVALADTVGGMVIAFNTGIDSAARLKAKQTGVAIKSYNIIYDMLDDVEGVVSGMFQPEMEEVVVGRAEVLKVFKTSGGRVAGCMVQEGVINSNSKVRVIRADEVIHDSQVVDLRHFQDQVSQVKAGQECGVKIAGFDRFKEGDILEFYEMKQVQTG